MMRSVWVATLSFLLIFGVYLFSDGACSRASEELVQGCREAEESVRSGGRVQALELLETMEQQWAKKADYFSFFVDHQRIEAIEEKLRMAHLALEHGREYDVFSSLYLLKDASTALHEAEAFVLKNIW